MNAPARYYKGRALSISQQLLKLRQSPEGFGHVRQGILTWNYCMQPTEISRVYKIRLTYQLKESPKVCVMDPNLTLLAKNQRIPHVYKHKHPVQLCLYLPYMPRKKIYSNEWNNTDFLTDLLPWSKSWLFYFEVWLFSGNWEGGGRHPE